MISQLKHLTILFLVIFSIGYINLAYCVTLQGHVYINKIVSNAPVRLIDNDGVIKYVKADDKGFYSLDIEGLNPPFVLSTYDANLSGNVTSHNCSDSSKTRAKCIAALLFDIKTEQTNIANINPLTDSIASYVANLLNLNSPLELSVKGSAGQVTQDMVNQAYLNFHQTFDKGLNQATIDSEQFDPVASSNYQEINKILDLIHHNRSYNTADGTIGKTILLDMRLRPITKDDPFDYLQAMNEKEQNLKAKTRIFIFSDSTASNYSRAVFPRMGWGQVFDQLFKSDSDIVILNASQSGRSSRDFYNAGWYELVAGLMQPGDYVMIAFGHNDEKCDGLKAGRGVFDVATLCTYPNDRLGNKQFPANQPEMSFQNSLERYINIAKNNKMTPILMTPVTRFNNVNNKTAYEKEDMSPVVSNHYTMPKEGFLFSGNYSDTVKMTALDNDVVFIDLEKLSIDFANRHKDDWQSYWLVINPKDYPYYQNQLSGTINKPDTTHFQQKGALAIANTIANAIKNEPKLKNIANQLKDTKMN